MMDMRILVVDDDLTTGLYLKRIIEEVPGVTVVAIAANGREGMDKAREHDPHAVFLDIDTPEMSGLELARNLVQWHNQILIVFATAYPDYTAEGFELHSFDYILKPLNEERVKRTVYKLKEQVKNLHIVETYPADSIIVEYLGKRIFLNQRRSSMLKALNRKFI